MAVYSNLGGQRHRERNSVRGAEWRVENSQSENCFASFRLEFYLDHIFSSCFTTTTPLTYHGSISRDMVDGF